MTFSTFPGWGVLAPGTESRSASHQSSALECSLSSLGNKCRLQSASSNLFYVLCCEQEKYAAQGLALLHLVVAVMLIAGPQT